MTTKLEKFYEMIYDELQSNNDRIVVVLGNEGVGKSCFMMTTVWMWRGVRGVDQSADACMERIAWDSPQFKRKLADSDYYEAIVSHDAARLLRRKKAMHSDQLEIEEDLLDARQSRNFMLLGYQDFADVPTNLSKRRAANVIRIPSRGRYEVYGRKHIDKYNEDGKWPQPAFAGRFDHIEGTELWEKFQARDDKEKRDRIAPDESEHQAMTEQELAEQIIEDGDVEKYVSTHAGNGQLFLDGDLISMDFGISGRKGSRVKKLLEREVDVYEVA